MQPRVAIIGAGFGGIAVAAALRKAGHDNFVLLEKAAYEAVAMSAPLATTARGKAIQAAVRPWREEMCMAVLSVGTTRRVRGPQHM